MESGDSRGGYRMASEFCCEAAVLIFVFGNLDVWFKSFTGELDKFSAGAITLHVITVWLLAAVFEASGVLFEKWRQK
jgi:hypothetical protein